MRDVGRSWRVPRKQHMDAAALQEGLHVLRAVFSVRRHPELHCSVCKPIVDSKAQLQILCPVGSVHNTTAGIGTETRQS